MDTKKLRIKYNNEWPIKFNFPVEDKFLALMSSKGISHALVAADLNYSEDRQFQFYLGYLIDSLDMLPLRPDLAFDHIWKALDSEFFIVQQEIGNLNCSRFDGFVDRILNDSNTATSFLEYLPIIPYQTCEYAAKRMIQASLEADKNAKTLFSRVNGSLGKDFVTEFIAKYPPALNGKPNPSDQRKAGRLLKIMFSGEDILLNGSTFTITEKQKAMFLVKVVLANSRNERFHGGVFPPFRSSVAKLSTYSHAYYLLHISYALLLDVFLYREYNVIDIKDVVNVINNNITLFKILFNNVE